MENKYSVSQGIISVLLGAILTFIQSVFTIVQTQEFFATLIVITPFLSVFIMTHLIKPILDKRYKRRIKNELRSIYNEVTIEINQQLADWREKKSQSSNNQEKAICQKKINSKLEELNIIQEKKIKMLQNN